MDLESLPKPEGTIPRNAGVLQPFVPYVLLFLFFFAISASYAASLSEKESHRKMVALLEEIRAQDLDDNPYQGEGRLRQLEDQLQALPDAAPAQDKISLHFSLGIAELFLGRERRALDHLAAAEGMLAAQRSVPSHVVNEIHFRLGLAWLRLGETQNCVLNPNADHCILPIRPGGFHTLPEGSRQAIPYFQAVLDNTAAEERLRLSARWLLNIAYMTLGQYPERVPPAHRIPPKAFESQAAFPRWVNVAPALGLDTFSLSGGAVADDFDGDGYLDFFVSTSDLTGQLRFFRNGGDGTLRTGPRRPTSTGYWVDSTWCKPTTTTTATSTCSSCAELGSASMASIPIRCCGMRAMVLSSTRPLPPVWDRTTTRPKPPPGATTISTAISTSTSAMKPPRPSSPPANSFKTKATAPSPMWLPPPALTNTPTPKQSFGATTTGTAGRIYMCPISDSPTGSTTIKATAPSGMWLPLPASSPLGPASQPGFGTSTTTVTSTCSSLHTRPPLPTSPPRIWAISVSVEQARLYRGDGQGGFADVSQDRHLAQPTKPMGANFGDVDHDGFLDVYLGTGDTDYAELMPNVLYWNQAGQRFADVTFASGLGHLQKGHGVVFADVDHDGDVDLFEQMGGAYRGDGFADVLYENPGFGHGWLAVEVVGVESNRSGIGTQLRVDVVEGGQRRSLYRWVGSGGSFGGNPLRQYVGLGSAERVAQLVVFWPQSDREQVFDEVPSNAIIRVTEGRDQLEILALPAFKFDVEHPKRAEHHLHQ